MSKSKKYKVQLINKGQINLNLHYGPYTRDWWIQDSKTSNNSILTLPFRLYMNVVTQINEYEFFLSIVNRLSNPLQPGFLCSVGEKISDIQDTPSAAINLLYKEIFGTQTQHSGLAVFGFYDEKIRSEILTDISFFPLYISFDKFSIVVSRIGYSSRKDFLYAGSSYTSSLIMRHGSEYYLILQQILDNQCSLRIFKGKNEIQQYVGETPIVVWKHYGMHQNKDHFGLFGLKDPKVQALLTNGAKKNICTCTSLEWNDELVLQQIFDIHIKRRKLSMPNNNWKVLFTKWITQQSSIIQMPQILYSIYPPNFVFHHKELAAWRSMFKACGCTNITPYSKEESDVEFWTCAIDPWADQQTLQNLYKWELLQIQNQDSPCNITTNCQFWNSFRNALDINKRGAKGKIQLLSIIALDFHHQELENELGVRYQILVLN